MKNRIYLVVFWLLSICQVTHATTPDGLIDIEWQSIQNQITGNSQQTYIKASPVSTKLFGVSTALFMDTLVVGAQGNPSDAGAIYVFTRTAGVWSQQAHLQASNAEAGDQFGVSVAISGDTIVVGADREDSNATGVNGDEIDNSVSYAGAAYVFTRTSGVWTQQAYLKSSGSFVNGFFGNAVAISGDTIVIGAYNENSTATQSGSAYVFVRNANIWTHQSDLFSTNSISNNGKFGNAVAIFNDTIAIGSPSESGGGMLYIGGVYVFDRVGAMWGSPTHLQGFNTETNDQFGFSVALNADTLVVGAVGESSNATGVNGNQGDNSSTRSGAAYIFNRSASTWTQVAYLKASNPDDDDELGQSVAISGNIVVIGARWEQSNGTGINGNATDNSINASGATYSFIFQDGSWTPQFYIKASNTQQTGTGDWFGTSVAIFGETVVVGAPWEDSNAIGINGDEDDNSQSNSGAVYVYYKISDNVFNDGFE